MGLILQKPMIMMGKQVFLRDPKLLQILIYPDVYGSLDNNKKIKNNKVSKKNTN